MTDSGKIICVALAEQFYIFHSMHYKSITTISAPKMQTTVLLEVQLYCKNH
jgi:hypothetical protein